MPESIRNIGTMGATAPAAVPYDAGDPNAVSPGSTSREAIYLDGEGNVLATQGPDDRIPEGAVTKLSRYEYDQRVKSGQAKAEPAAPVVAPVAPVVNEENNRIGFTGSGKVK